jgi:SAM-dependent methyltransferase
MVLDVGTGTGVMATAIKPLVRHIIGIDISGAMLTKGKWDGISLVKWDINDSLFHNGIFDKIVGRMVFHHILDNLDRAFLRCYDLLKEKGHLIIAEGVPPSDDQEVIDWYSHMFSFKETRRTFTLDGMLSNFKKNGFKRVKPYVHIDRGFNINNWLSNSGLAGKNQKHILDLHWNAPAKVKKAYNMREVGGECLVDTKNIIVVGGK